MQCFNSQNFFELKQKFKLKPTKAQLQTFDSSEFLPVMGEFDAEVIWEGKCRM